MCKLSILEYKKAPAFDLLLMPFCFLFSLLLDEPLPELPLLSQQSALTVPVLTHQAREHHLSIAFIHFSEAVRVIKIELTPATKLLVLMPVGHLGFLHVTLLLLPSVLEDVGYFDMLEQISVCFEKTCDMQCNSFSITMYKKHNYCMYAP